MKQILIDTAKKHFESMGIKFGKPQTYRDVPKLSIGYINKDSLDDKFIPKTVEFRSIGHIPYVVIVGTHFKKNGEPKSKKSILFEIELKDED